MDADTTGSSQLVIDSEHRLRSENLPWDIDVWYPSVQQVTFRTQFLPLTIQEGRAILSFHDVSWRHAKDALLPEEISILRNLECALDQIIASFPGGCAFIRLCGRSPKDGEPFDRKSVRERYDKEICNLLDAGKTLNGNTKMIAISRTPTLKVTSGKEAMSLLLTSERVYSDMLDWLKYGEPEQICIREWDEEMVLENEFRVFVHNNRITAISQYDHYTYFPSLEPMKQKLLCGLQEAWENSHTLLGSPSYVVDIAYIPAKQNKNERFVIIEYSPFLPCTGSALFSWTSDINILEGIEPMEFRIKAKQDVHPQIDDLVEINWYVLMKFIRPLLSTLPLTFQGNALG